MATASLGFVEPFTLPQSLGPEQDVENLIRRLVADKTPLDRRLERRRDSRYAYPYPLRLTPLDAAQRGDFSMSISAIGKHITIHGVDFYTGHPVAAKEVVCQFAAGNASLAVVLELNWCRHNAQGWFENGGKFSRIWKSPNAPEN